MRTPICFFCCRFPVFVFFLFLTTRAAPQSIQGIVLDKATEIALPGAVIDLPGQTPAKGAVTGSEGSFIIPKLAPGRYIVRIKYLGYDDETLPDVLVTTGKDAVLRILLEENKQSIQEVTISGSNKIKPVNRLAKVSAIALNPETVARYSGGRSNIARMAANYAGVGATDDYQNDLVVRGNSPTGLLWRLEGIPIPSPGHLSTYGNSGGSFNAVNPNLLGQSDFLTGAFPAEFGNTVAGVMDMNFRSGNKEKLAGSVQAGAWSGAEAELEGPILKKQNGSFLIGYRYSFVDLLHSLGARVGGKYVPQYQDLNWKVDFGKGRSHWEWFGLTGQSHIYVSGRDVDPNNLFHSPTQDSELGGGLLITGLRQQTILDSFSFIRTILAYTGNRLSDRGWNLTEPTGKTQWLDQSNLENSVRGSAIWQRRQSTRLTLRAGLQVQASGINTHLYTRTDSTDYVTVRQYNGTLWLGETFAQMQYKVKKRYSINAGLHSQYSPLLKRATLEPRAALKFKLQDDHDLTLAYGYHTQTPSAEALFYQTPGDPASNQRLDFLRSHQLVLAWTKKWKSEWHFRMETYFQLLDHVPVHQASDGFSLLNLGSSFDSGDLSHLVSSGTGRNYGLEITLNKVYRNGFYGLVTASVFSSQYRGSDGIWRNTAFNCKYILNCLAGKEFPLSKHLTFSADSKVAASGGRWYSPINLPASIAAGDEVHDFTQPFALQYPGFFRWDLKFGMRFDASRLTHHLYLDFTNLTNRKNVYAYSYFRGTTQISTQYQLGITPDFIYRLEF
jgi:hypothetical protein